MAELGSKPRPGDGGLRFYSRERQLERLHLRRQFLLIGRKLIIGGSLIVLISGFITVLSKVKWPDWTGFGEDTVIKKSTERKNRENGPIEKVTFTEEPQPGKTLWDLLQLTGTLAVLILIVYLSNKLQGREKEIANANLRDEALEAYLDRMSDLLLNKNLRESKLNEPVQDVARAITLTLLRRLENDGERKAKVLSFLYDAEILGIFSLVNADFSGVSLKGADLKGADLSGFILEDADLSHAKMHGSILNRAKLNRANLDEARFSDAKLIDADLRDASLVLASLCSADLTNAKLGGADLYLANFHDADLKDAELRYFKDSYPLGGDKIKLRKNGKVIPPIVSALIYPAMADLERTHLEGAKNITVEQVKVAENWEKAYYSTEFRQNLGLPPKNSEHNENKT
jgi:uncharacterized protein YjbI with pentapeptide repeats